MNYCYKEYACGCEISTDNTGWHEIEYCFMHSATPKLYKALKRIVKSYDGINEKYCPSGLGEGREVIAEVEKYRGF